MLRVSSYNCKSLKRNVDGIRKLCDVSDVLFLQEHWLFPHDLAILNVVHNEFTAFGCSSIDSSDRVILGRPFGGVAVLWRSKLAPLVRPVSFDDDRIIGLECNLDGHKLLLLGVYLPYDTRHNFDQYVYYLAKLKGIIDDFGSPNVCVVGDFNADVIKRSDFGRELESFCHEAHLRIADISLLPQSSVTHINDGTGTESWIDHIVCTNSFYSLIRAVRIDVSILSSDHFPMCFDVELSATSDCSNLYDGAQEGHKWVVDWSSLDVRVLNNYAMAAKEQLSKIEVPLEAMFCSVRDCSDHRAVINAYYEAITHAIKIASQSTVAKRASSNRKRIIPGWTEFVEDKHTLLGDVYSLWSLVGKPRQGYIYSQLQMARSQFKYALRFCIKNEKDLRAKSLADKFARNPRDLATFWKEVRKLNAEPPLPQSIGSVSGEQNVADMWKDHFSDILNSVGGEACKDNVLKELRNVDAGADLFSVHKVLECTHELSSGRSPGCDNLTAEHYKLAGVPCATHLSLCFSMMISHGFLPPSLSKVVLRPIVKDKTGNLSDKDNYRPIALATVSSKILERVILNRCKSSLLTSEHQFGFKDGHSTDMAVYALKEIVDHYLRNRSAVFVCFLDARKAFDRVNHWTLFDKLLRRGMDRSVVRLLVSWRESQRYHVLWGKALSEGFSVTNGVRQGGILSPYLFNVYTDHLSDILDRSGVGCHYLGSVNHLYYADDMVLLAPTPHGLQKMVDICAEYAEYHDILFNTKKSVCMAIIPPLFKNMTLPDIVLCGNVLGYVDKYKYLGFHLSKCPSKTDDLEVQQQYRLLCCRANSLIRKFAMCSYSVKRYLYSTYCSNVYGVHLWHSYRSSVLRKFTVCFNNAARMFFGYHRFCSASEMFVKEGIENFTAMYRKAVYGFILRLSQTDNRIVSGLFDSDLAFHSSIRKVWHSALYHDMIVTCDT